MNRREEVKYWRKGEFGELGCSEELNYGLE